MFFYKNALTNFNNTIPGHYIMDEPMTLELNQVIDELPELNQPLLDKLLNQKIVALSEQTTESQVKRYPYSVIGGITKFDQQGYAIVHFVIEKKDYNLKTETTVALNSNAIGQKCVINFNQGNLNDPIITGLIQAPQSIDDAPLVIESETAIVLQCGSSRIELSKEGTINIQGMHINSQAYGPNRIKGGSVKIN